MSAPRPFREPTRTRGWTALRARRVATWLAIGVLGAASPARAIGLAEERDLGARFALEARVQLPLLREPAVTGYLRGIGNRLSARLESQPFSYRFFVVRDQNLNAFAVPGGYVYVHTGLLLGALDEAELAGVLAHELVHVSAHHVVRQQEKTALINYGTLLGLFLSVVHPALGAGAVAAGTAAQLKYQREFEQEADHVGVGLMAPAGFDPAGMPAFLRRVLREQRLNPAAVPPYFLSHPLTEDRVAALEQRLASLPRPAPRPGGGHLAAAQATVRALSEPLDKVLPAYEAGVVSAPEDPRPQHLLGLVHLYGGRPAVAEPLLARAVAGTLPGALGDHGRALARLGRADEARRDFEAQLRVTPDDAAVQMELGRLVLAAGESKRAAALLERALELDPELDDAEYALAEARGKSGDAREQWIHLGRAFELRGEMERAGRAYAKALALTPEDTPAHESLEKTRRAVESADRSRP